MLTTGRRPLKVFLCHASLDKPKVRELYRYLRRRGIKPWFDEIDLVGGQDWQIEIPKALSTSDAIIICLTQNSVDKEGYVQKEIKFALDKALEMPEGRIFLIPVRFEECEVPFSLSRYQWVDLFDEAGYARMMRSLKFRASQLERATVELSKKDIEAERFALEKAAREKQEREAAEKAKREKAEREAAEKIKQEKVEREKAEKEAREKARYEEIKKRRLPYYEASPLEKPSNEELKPEKPPRKPNTAIIVGLIGLAGTMIAALLSSPLIEKWFSAVPVSTEMATTTMTLTSQSVTLTPTPLPTEIMDSKGVPMMLVPDGEFIMGSDDSGYPDEKPAHDVYLDAYYIDKYEVTNALYRACVNAQGCTDYYNQYVPSSDYYDNPQYDNYPIYFGGGYGDKSWWDAKTYCEWRDSRLPTEAEWEKAARGTNGRIYPWGDGIDCSKANYGGCVGSIAVVGSYESGKSPYGVYDMAGNVWEWTSSLHMPYPYDMNDGRENLDISGFRIMRGASWNDISNRLMVTYRGGIVSRFADEFQVGFRCAKDASP